MVRALNVISDSATHDLLRSGFPTSLYFRVELWSSGGLFNSLISASEWAVIVRYDALARHYRLLRVDGERVSSIGQFSSFADAVAAVERPMRAPIRARQQRDRQYYTVSLDVETLSANDLDELLRWFRGELQPAVRGERNPGTALGRLLRRMAVRLLGAERRNLQIRSITFRVPE
jgi:hypothetical protein